MKCKVCNNIIADGSKFCLYCGSPIEDTQNTLSKLEKVRLDDVITELYEYGNIKKAYDLLLPLYESHKDNEYVKEIYYSILIRYDSVSARNSLEYENKNSLYKYLVLIDVNLFGDLLKVENLIELAEVDYPNNLLIKCRKAIFLYIAYTQIQSQTLLDEYNTVVSKLSDASNKIERTWKLKAEQIKDIYENPSLFTKEYCKEKDVYYNLFISRISSSNDTIVVSKDGFGDFLTISEAINAADENATIIIQEGVFYETFNINKPLIIKGEGNSNPIILFDDKCVCSINSKVQISNIDFCNSLNYENELIANYGLVEVYSDVVFSNCNFLDSCSTSVCIKADNIKVEFNNCIIKDSVDYGIYCDKECVIIINNCCFLDIKNDAVSLSKTSLEIKNTKFSNIFGLVINIEDSSLLNVKNCDVSNSNKCGLNIHNVETVTISESKIYKCLRGGLNVQNSKSCNFSSISIYDINSTALVLDKVDKSNVSNISVYNNIGFGIWISKEGKSKLSHCNIYGNHSDNIFVDGSADVEIDTCNIKKGQGKGISFIGSSMCHCRNSVIDGNKEENVYLDDSSNTNFENCQISMSTYWGIIIRKDSINSFSKCNIRNNIEGDIKFLDNSKCILSYCSIDGLGQQINVLCSSSNEILIEYGNIGYNNVGVYIENNSSPHLRGVLIEACEENFIFNNAGNVVIEDCSIHEAKETFIKAYNSNDIIIFNSKLTAITNKIFIIENNSRILFDKCLFNGISDNFEVDSSSEASFVKCMDAKSNNNKKIEDQVINKNNLKIV